MNGLRLRTFEHYVKQWQAENPSYGNPDLPPGTNQDQDVPGEASSYREPLPVDNGKIPDVNHDDGTSFDQRTANSMAEYLQPIVFNYDTTGDVYPSSLEEPPRLIDEYSQEQPVLGEILSTDLRTIPHDYVQSDFGLPEWGAPDAFMTFKHGALHTPSV
jgi:hypothetical protein